MKREYQTPEIIVTYFGEEDIVTVSGLDSFSFGDVFVDLDDFQ